VIDLETYRLILSGTGSALHTAMPVAFQDCGSEFQRHYTVAMWLGFPRTIKLRLGELAVLDLYDAPSQSADTAKHCPVCRSTKRTVVDPEELIQLAKGRD
jgi:hypothetical protein